MPYSTDEHTLPCNTTMAEYGMSLRDWFAGQALVGIIGNSANAKNLGSVTKVVGLAFEFADAMLEARKEKL